MIRPFAAGDQPAVKALILDGLVEHWGWLDESKNPDLDDILISYRGALFLVACAGDQIVGSGALKPHSPGAGEIVRMSVAAPYRRQGVGRLILARLLCHAAAQGLHKVILETTATWEDVINFYLRGGFHISHYEGEDVYFELELRDSPYSRADFSP